MAAGLAHEVKNPLSSVHAFVQLLSRKHDDRHFIEQFNRVVLREVDRINAIVEELLDLARPAPLHSAPLDVMLLLQRVTETYAEQMRQPHVHLQTEWPTTMPTLEADAEQLHRAFGNIVLNTLEAMPEGGVLRVTCRVATTSPGDVLLPAQATRPGSAALNRESLSASVEIVFHDTGVGIPAEQLDALFTPFYTTKRRGTGLGLALTHKIIEEHGGSIHITSEVDRGTAVTVTLPMSSGHLPTVTQVT